MTPNELNYLPIEKPWIIPPLFIPHEYEEGEVEAVMVIVTGIGIHDDWRQPIIDYLQHGKLLDDVRKKIDIRQRAPRFIYFNDTLFRRSFGLVLLRCLSSTEADQAMNEAHSGVGDMVLAVKRPIHIQRKNAKMMPKWDGPYVVQEAYTSGSYLLADQEGKKVGPINGHYLKQYYP
ncbi:hypothetical protein LIER_06748 [Lithospermum erythrorhizon]|uniref:Uncharacterized protein n=1 Tax=Lithospermum erythrorhizon TaxID=34254 RepID=A0AAV3P6Q1_LITER